MKTLKFKNYLMKALSLVLVLFVMIALVGCDENKTEQVKISIKFDKTEYYYGETIEPVVTVTGTENTDYVLTIDSTNNNANEIVKVNGNKVEIISNPANDSLIKIIATSKADETVYCNDSILVKHKDESVNVDVNVKIILTADKTVLKYGETAKLSVKFENTDKKDYTYRLSSDIVKIENDVLTVVKEVKVSTTVSVSAISTEYSYAQSTVTFTIKPIVQTGKVEDLTSEMLQEIGSASITVKGTLVDHYINFNNHSFDTEHTYNMDVQMSENAWKGTWSISGQEENAVTYNYRMGELDGVTDSEGNKGHALTQLYIDKNNKVASDYIKDYRSIPTVWETQHLWNHLGELDINKVSYDSEENLYKYDISTYDDLQLMAYLAVCLTPVLDGSTEYFEELYFQVENGKISKIIAQTQKVYSPEDADPSEYEELSYSIVELTFENVGTTTVEDPKPFESPEHVDILNQAIEKMQSLRNYTFHAVDTQTAAPSTSDDDYSLESVVTTNSKLRKQIIRARVANGTYATGTVGQFGQITENEVLYANTIKYTSSLDDKVYNTTYSGLKKIDSESYDVFKYDSTQKTLVGERRKYGDLHDALPKFNFSADIFEFEIASKSKEGKTLYKFVLRDSSITREVAIEFSCYSYAVDATESTQYKLYLIVDEDGNLVKSFYPYDLVYGTYLGYVTTTYSKFNETEIEFDTFDNYIPREIKKSWSEYNTKYYQSNPSEQSREMATDVVLAEIFGDSASDVPNPEAFIKIFGDALSGPFYDLSSKGYDGDGNPIYIKSIGINTQSTEYDENSVITNYDELMDTIITEFVKLGFTVSKANTDMTGGESGLQDRYLCLIKGDVQIVIMNNRTKNIFIEIYKTGDWTLNR